MSEDAKRPQGTALDHLARLFRAYDMPFGVNGETITGKVESYLLAVKGQGERAVGKAVDDFLSGAVDRKKANRAKLPTSDEFGGHVREVAALVQAGKDADAMAYAPPFGPLWGVKLYEMLNRGADAVLAPPTAFFANMIANGGTIGMRYQLEHQANNGFRAVNGMFALAADAKGCMVEIDLKPLMPRMEPVPVDGRAYMEWRYEHYTRGWPWLPDTGKQRVVYLPKDGVAGLEQLLTVLPRRGDGGSKV